MIVAHFIPVKFFVLMCSIIWIPQPLMNVVLNIPHMYQCKYTNSSV